MDTHGEDTPIRTVLERLADERYTGEVVVGDLGDIHVWMDDGGVYLAERDGEGPLASRLVAAGAVTAEEIERATVRLGGTESIAGLFVREPGLERDRVVQVVQRMTADVLDAVGTQAAGRSQLHPLRHHPSGAHQWLPVVTPPRQGPGPIARDVLATTTPTLPGGPAPRPAVAAGLATLSPLPSSGAAPAAPVAPAAPALPTLPSLASLSTGDLLHPVQHDPRILEREHRLEEAPRLDRTTLPQLATSGQADPAGGDPTPTALPTSQVPVFDDDTAPASPAWSAPPGAKADEIWDMVDDMLGLPHPEDPVVTNPPESDKKRHGWLRRKG